MMKIHCLNSVLLLLAIPIGQTFAADGDQEGMIQGNKSQKCWQADDTTPNLEDYDKSFIRLRDCDETNAAQRFTYLAASHNLKSLAVGDCIDNYYRAGKAMALPCI